MDKYKTYYYQTDSPHYLIAVPSIADHDMRVVVSNRVNIHTFDIVSTLRPEYLRELRKFARENGLKVKTRTCAVTFEYA